MKSQKALKLPGFNIWRACIMIATRQYSLSIRRERYSAILNYFEVNFFLTTEIIHVLLKAAVGSEIHNEADILLILKQ